MVSPALIFTLLIVVSVLLLVLAYVYHLYLSEKHKRTNVHPQAPTILDAQQRAQAIVDKAVTKAQDSLLHTEYLRQELITEGEESLKAAEKKILDSLDQEGRDHQKEYQTLFENVRSAYAAKVDESLKMIENAGVGELKKFGELSGQKIAEMDVLFQNKLNEEMEKTSAETAAYKEQQLKKVDEGINTLILKVLEEVGGKVIPIQNHEKIVFEALESAKRENVFYEFNPEDKKESTTQGINTQL